MNPIIAPFPASASSRALGFALALSVLLIVGGAQAHAPPKATGIYWAETSSRDSARTFVRTNRGLIVIAPDGEATPPALLCNDAWEASLSEIAPVLPTESSVLVASFFGGLLLAANDLCSFSSVDLAFGGRRLVDLRSGAGSYFALTSATADEEGTVFASSNGGLSWQARASTLEFGTALVAAPSDADVLYVSQTIESADGTPAGELGVSEDAGHTFSFRPIPINPDEVRPFVVGVDPTDPQRVFLRMLAANGDMPERLLLSEDAGKTIRDLTSIVGPLEFAIDGKRAFLGGRDGVFRSDDGGLTFAPLPTSPSHVGCVVIEQGDLYVCGYAGDEFGVLRSSDSGETFSWFLRFPEVTDAVSCPADSPVQLVCEAEVLDWKAEQSPAGGEAAQAGGGGAGMGGAAASASGAGSGLPGVSEQRSSGCQIGSRASAASFAPMLWCLLLSSVFLTRLTRQKR